MEREGREVWQGAELPEWIRLLPLGTVELADDREPFEVDREALANMVEGFQSRGVDLVVDYEHQSLKGDRAPAAGWIKGLEARGDGLWARVEWTAQAGEYLRQREYRYFSPVLKLDPATRRPVNLMNVALTNVPAIKGLTPLVARWGGAPVERRSLPPGSGASMETGKEKAVRLQELRARLGLTSEAQEEALWQTAEEVLRDLAQAAGLAEDAPASRLKGGIKALRVTSEKYGALEAELETLKARVKEEEASRAVESARFTTFFLALIDRDGPSLAYCNAGHNPPLKTRTSMTNERIQEIKAARRVSLDSLPLQSAIKIVKGDGKRRVAIFTDPNCPYCKQLEKELINVTNVTIYTLLYPVLKGSMELSKKIWCSDNQIKTWDNFMLKGVAPSSKDCETPVDAVVKPGHENKVSGTPTLIFADGSVVGGMIPATVIEEKLENASKSK